MYMSTLFGAAWYHPQNWPYIALAIFGLGFVIFVHELGHFVVAKLCGVKCEKFYVGFDVPIKLGWGKFGIQLPAAIWKKQWGETEYGIGMIPLGGYVKMLGQDDNPGRQAEMSRLAHEEAARKKGQASGPDPDSQAAETPARAKQDGDENFVFDPRSYMAQSVPERMAIISAGVVMNIIFAFIFAMIAFGMGVSYQRCEIAYVVPGTPAWMANLQPGYEIVEIADVKKNLRFKDLRQEVILGDANGIPVVVEWKNEQTGKIEKNRLIIKPKKDERSGLKIPQIGVAPTYSLTLNGEQPTLRGWPAAGKFHGKDEIVAVNGEPVDNYVDFSQRLAENVDKPLTITVARAATPPENSAGETRIERDDIEIAPTHLKRFGLVMKMSPVLAVQPDSPADTAGIKAGDQILKIDGQPVGDPIDLPEKLRQRGGETISIEIRRKVGDGFKTIKRDVHSRKVEWFTYLASTMELSTFGIAYRIEPVIDSIRPGSAADGKNFEPGDRITQLQLVPASSEKEAEELEAYPGGNPVKEPLKVGDDGFSWPYLIDFIQGTLPDTAVKLTVEREKKTHAVELVPQVDPESIYAERGFVFVHTTDIMKADSIGEAMSLGWRETKYAMFAVYRFLHKLLSGDISPRLLGGPGTILAAAGMSAKLGFPDLLIFLTLLSANLAVVNFLPIPVLDGGHMVFLILEGIFRKPVSERVVIPLTYLGLFLILGLMLFVIGLDVDRWVFDFF
jgi:regulator of sigma E protease